MQHRTKLATAVAVALTLMSGIAAFGATTGLLIGEPERSAGKERLVEQATPASGRDTPTDLPGGSQPNGATQTASGSGPVGVAAIPAAHPAGSAPISAVSPATTLRSGAPAAPAPADVDTESDPPPPTTTPTTPAVNPGPPAVDCHGSDDGMSEAQKQARERACQGANGGD
jgi:hypothetical protein